MVTYIDLRVHAAAPSSKTDDNRFLAQADAYAGFAPVTKLHLLTCHNPKPIAKSPRELRVEDDMAYTTRKILMVPPPSSAVSGNISEIPWDPTTFLEDTKFGYSALQSQLFTAPLRATNAPRRRLVECITVEPTTTEEVFCPSADYSSHASSISLQNVASRSSKFKSPDLARATKKARLDDNDTREAVIRRSPETGSSPDHEIDASTSSPNTKRHANDVSPQELNHSSYLASPVLSRLSKGSERNLVSTGAMDFNEYAHTLLVSPLIDDGFDGLACQSGKEKKKSVHLRSVSTQGHRKSLSVDSTTSELPTSYSLSDVTSGSSETRQRSILDCSTSDPGSFVQNSNRTASLLRTPRPIAQKHVKQPLRADVDPATQHALVVTRDIGVTEGLSKSIPTYSTADGDGASASDLPVSIYAPSPKVALEDLGSQVTPALRHLAERADLDTSYKPMFITREPGTLERGHWLLNISSWSAEIRSEFFQFLERMIGDGCLGWGVWCTRDADDFLTDNVKVYCWGEIIRQIYLVLYVASMSRVRKLGLQWVDAEGKIVVQMRGACDVV